LGDARLERRLQRVAEELAGRPEYPINQASEDAAATKAAYRLFNNDRVTAERIFGAHRERVFQRMRNEPVVLAIQDTSFFNFSSHKKTRGLGPIGDRETDPQGLIIHSTFAATPTGLPLGVLGHTCWARVVRRSEDKDLTALPIEEKESYRWVETLRETSKISVTRANNMIITVADRESDVYEFLLEAQQLNAKYVIRSSHDRCVQSTVGRWLHEELAAFEPKAVIELEVPTQKRRATLSLTFGKVELCPPKGKPLLKNAKNVVCWAVRLSEDAPPADCEPLSWTLLTNIPIASVEQAVEKVSWYRRRWAIEEFHKILKSGCTVEDCRLQTADRLKRYLALFCVIAWRLFWMVHISRADPTAPAEVVLTQSEIGTITTLKRFRDKLPRDAALTVRAAVIAVACLGGYLNRKNDPQPGATVIWRGWQRLSSMTELYESVVPGCG
jgi:Transposase DNA-binding/Transposase Tn5 dimerisation domain